MTHQFEFIAQLLSGDKVHLIYKGKSSRHNKVRLAIIKDLKKMYNIEPNDVGDIYLKPYKEHK